MAEVIINVGANTQDANAQINQLNQSLGKTGDAAAVATKENAQLEATLKKQEATIKTIDGAINLLGGSVELLAGSLVLSGAATEEQAKEFEAAALGAIALADGAKRTFDGIKSLNEGLAESGGFVKTLQTQFQNLYKVVLANPFVALAAALAAVAVAYESVRSEAEKNARITKEELELTNELNAVRAKSIDPLDRSLEVLTDSVEQRGLEVKAIEDLKKAYPGFEAFLTRENKLTEQGILFLKTKIAIRKDEAALALLAQKQVEEEIKREERLAENARENRFGTQRFINERNKILKESEAALKLLNDQEQVYLDRVNKEFEAIQKLQPVLDRQVASSKEELTERQKINEARVKSLEQIKEENKLIVEGFIARLGGIEAPKEGDIKPQLPPDPLPELEKRALSFAEYLKKLNGDLNEFFEGETGKAVGASLATAANLARTLAESQDESTEKAFEASKKYKIAAVVTSAIQSSFEAFGAAQQFGPILGPILGAAQVAAIAIASNKAIADIKNSKFQSPGSPSVSTGGGGSSAALAVSPSFGAGGFLGQPQGTLTPVTTPQGPLRAYVVSSDVTNGQQAQAQINRRRTLAPG